VEFGMSITVLLFLIYVDAILMKSMSTFDENFERTFVFAFFNKFEGTDVANVLLEIVLGYLSPHAGWRCVVSFELEAF